MWTAIGRAAVMRTLNYSLLIWICIFCVEINVSLARNETTQTQKKPRSVQYGALMPRIQSLYARQTVPVRLATIPVNNGYRIPITQSLTNIAPLPQRLTNVAPLARIQGLQRNYVPIVSSVPQIRYPVLRQGVSSRYVLPYTLKMPGQSLSAGTGEDGEDVTKHYNEKYNTLPSISNMGLEQDGLNVRGKTESKKIDIGDDFDNFLESLDAPCAKHPCKNGAKCRISRDGTDFHCICKRGYRGTTCEDKNACFPNPCQNNGECTMTDEGFECSCPKGYKGNKCEQENTCEPNPCENDGVCTELKNGGFECTCKKGNYGEKCQLSKRGCNPNPCQNNGHCSERDDGRYECTCAEGYTGTNCDKSDNKCLMNPCKNGGSCMQVMTSLGYECACTRGYRGTNCEEHSGCDITSCKNGGTCYETEFGVRCICKNGYSGDKCQIRKFCEADTCQNNGKCIEHASGFRCVCPEGYKGKTCDEMDSCRPNPCQHGGHCEQSNSGYFCKCPSQYEGRNCEIANPCSINPCKNGGKCIRGLDDQLYQCQCADGYLGTNCEERNVCMPNPCKNNGICEKNGAEFVCECQDGFEGKTCAEKDPCRNNPCKNNGVCTRNGINDFTCTCQDDYKGIRCEVQKRCRRNPCLNNGVCEETETDYLCNCKEGFRGQRCEEKDQCAPDPCKNGGRCLSVGNQGNGRAFVCECANSFFGDTCEERNPCHPNPCANNGQCTEINGGFTCQCRAGYKGDRCHEIDKCSPNPCQHQGSCSEVIGGLGYACKCAYGYKGQDCEKKDYCHPNPCDHDGQCIAVDGPMGFQCRCAAGFMGQRCTESNPCEPNPCQHNSQCLLLPGFGKNHECNCSIGWSGDTCEKREICHPNPCQFGKKCIETGDDSYSCVKSMCHPNPCQNAGKCINVNQDNFQCACTTEYEGKTCEGEGTDSDKTTHQDKSNRASIERHRTKSDHKPATTNIDNLLQLIDSTLSLYKSKHKQTNINKNKVTSLRQTVKNDINDQGRTQLALNHVDDDIEERQNNMIKHFISTQDTNDNPQITHETLQNTNKDEQTANQNQKDMNHSYQHLSNSKENLQNTNENLQITKENSQNIDPQNTNEEVTKLDEELIKSINPQGEVIVDSSDTPTEHSTTDNQGYDKDDIPTDLVTNLQTNVNQTKLEDSILDDINDEDAIIKSINPAGGVVVNNNSEVPRRHSQLSLVPSPVPPSYSQSFPVRTQLSQPLATTSSRVTNFDLKSGVPQSILLSTIASCSPYLCQNGGVCIQEADKSIKCKCPPMYSGATCEKSKCQENPCSNKGSCLPVEREPGFVCKCQDGHTGPLCSRKPCEPNPCKNNGQCVMFYSVYLCKCKSGFRGKLCEESTSGSAIGTEIENKPTTPQPAIILKDSKAHALCSPNPCKNNGQCMETSDGEYECICPEEYFGPQCRDEGEFTYSSARKFFPGENEECKHCDRNARCVNQRCICKNKYVGDGLQCWERTQKDFDWTCHANPCQNGGTCKNGRYGCVCRLGFAGDFCEEFSPPVVHLTFDKVTNDRLVDMSGNGNEAFVSRGFQIAPKEGKCDNAGNLLGGDIIFDGENFSHKPQRAITIAVWVKLTTALGIQSIFDTVGSHSKHNDGQYHFEIDNGRVRWFHRNEDGKTVFSVVTDQIVVREGNWTLVAGTYSADKNRARIFVNGDMIKEAKGHEMALSQDWGFKAGIATLPEVDIPYDEMYGDTNDNHYYKKNVVANAPDLANDKNNKDNNNDKIAHSLLKTAQQNNKNDDMNNNNTGYIEKILNKDKERLKDKDGSVVYTSINHLKSLKSAKDNSDNYNDRNFDISDAGRNFDNNSDVDNNKLDDKLMNYSQRIRRDGKHEHPYGARVLRGMVDEFSMFPSELSRLQLLVLMTNCKVYYNQHMKKKTKTTSSQFKETFTEIKPYSQSLGQYPLQSDQSLYYNKGESNAHYSGSTSPEQGYTSDSNYEKNGYQPSSTEEQAGYQRSQQIKRPTVSLVNKTPTGSSKVPLSTTSSPTYAEKLPPYAPHLPSYGAQPSPYGAKLPLYVPQSPSYKIKLPLYATQSSTYVPKPPSYQQASSRTGIPDYQSSYKQQSTLGYTYTPEPPQINEGFAKSNTPPSPTTSQYNPQWSGSNQDQLGYAGAQASKPSFNYGNPSYNSEYQQHIEDYNGYASRRNQEEHRDNYPEISTGQYITQTGNYDAPYNNMAYATSPSNAASQGSRYSNTPQNIQYNPAQYTGNTPSGQYQFMVPAQGQQDMQYGQPQGANAYSSGIKTAISQNNYQTGNQNPSWKNDVTEQMTPHSDVTETSYAGGLQSLTEDAYQRNNVYVNNNGMNKEYNPAPYTQNAGYISSYASIQPENRGPNYAYATGARTNQGAVRASIPRSKSPSGRLKSQMLTKEQRFNVGDYQGQFNGPVQNKNKLINVKKLDENGQYPSDIKRYNNLAQMKARKSPTPAKDTGMTSASYTGVKQVAYARNGNNWSTRTQTPSTSRTGKKAYDRWSSEMQEQKPDLVLKPELKVDEAVKYNNDDMTKTTTATNAGKLVIKDIDMDSIVQKALNDFLKTHILRKRRRRKRENAIHKRIT